ncbi:MAG: hypothetical protein Q9182_005088 [Xanthomendoza sp. 2 TL-2023]
MRPRASTRGSPIEPFDSPFQSPRDYESESSDSESESRMRGRSSGPPFGFSHQDTWIERPSTSTKLAPQPPGRVTTNLFGFLSSSATFSEMDLTGFRDRRDTLAMLALRRANVKEANDLSTEVLVRIFHYLDFHSYKSVRLTCRCWSAAATYARPLHLPSVYALPAEIIKYVYAYLSPLELNAARHTCRKWMIASLEHRLLAQILNRAGFRNAVVADTARNENFGHPLGGEWRLSKRLAIECSLCPGWTGNGFTDSSTAAGPVYRGLNQDPTAAGDANEKFATSLRLSATVDFTGLARADHARRLGQPPLLHFTVSSCANFLLVIDGFIMSVYYMRDLSSSSGYEHGGHLEFLISIACPGLVLAVSMDTSAGRYSIAALLEDRKGIIIDVPELSIRAGMSGSSSPDSESDDGARSLTETWGPKASPADATPMRSQHRRRPVYTEVYHTSPPDSSPDSFHPSPVPIQFLPHTIYRNLCTKISPPLTVAIAPHRRCVAFGSSAGIDLHWQDAMTGQELSRWMDLIGPAEHINFLLLGKQATSLRLTSSRTGPIYYSDPVGLDEAWDYENCKFLHAVPLSDGRHLLYTDPNDGDLCLGTGVHYPFGSPKPIKKFVLQGPEHAFEDKVRWPRHHNAGTDLRWGARVAAGFGDDIWLFCVPPDWLDGDGPSEISLRGDVERNADGFVVVRGAKIGSLPGLVELAVDASEGEVTVHAFSTGGAAQVYQVARDAVRGVRERWVGPDGRVMDRGLLVGGVAAKVRDFATGMPGLALGEEGIRYTGFQRLDGGEVAVEVQRDERGSLEVRETVDGMGRVGGEDEDEGYTYEEEEEEEEDGSRVEGWRLMDLVRLEVEVLCGG